MNVYLEYLDGLDLKNKNKTQICSKKFQIMVFLYNSINEGWRIHKEGSIFVFSKKHLGKKEFFEESYLSSFVESNLNIENLILN